MTKKAGRPKGSRTRSKWEKEFYKCPKLRPGPQKKYNIKDLAEQLGKNRRYVQSMRRAGFKMMDGLATYNDAIKWLHDNKMWFKESIYSELPRLQDQERPGENVKYLAQFDTLARNRSHQADSD